ncbi:MAG: amino acid oxidase [Clostridiales bacterium 43-6]|nr:MAG: amino acid oxidase [Clostridiales bacterium 43-6]
MTYDKIIIGAGLYGLYSALFCGRRGEKVVVLEYDEEPFMRASYINQARVHMGYHYPRSFSTAIKSAGYFNRFNEDYASCINTEFEKVYATSSNFSWTNQDQFIKFCKTAQIQCDELSPNQYFKGDMCDGTFMTKEYTYDAKILKRYLLCELRNYPNVKLAYSVRIADIKKDTAFTLTTGSREQYEAGFLLNATYASTNQIISMLGYEPFKIKYELCEIILCNVSEKLRNIGITVMDGPFFSIMPFGKTGYHSLTSVTFTPHKTSYSSLPDFPCMKGNESYCSPAQLGNCNTCVNKPQSAWVYMSNMARKYLKEEYRFSYEKSLFSIKPILMASEIDDSRPTVIKQHCTNPTFVSVLSGKINTVYDLDGVLADGNK